jgi:UDP-N-acetylglucosamine transferase subunit ALG13
MNSKTRLRICLAASGGGHLRQLLDLEPVWGVHDSFLVTEQTALAKSLATDHRTHFVTHVAAGQARLGKPWLMIHSALRNLGQAWRAISSERPDVVISTGAGAVFFAVLFARIRGAKVILIESFARFDRPSLFMRTAARLAHEKVVQSQNLASYWSDAHVFDPLRILDGPRPTKLPLLFVTVGATLPFDRMVSAVATLKREGEIHERVIAQVGRGAARPVELQTVETMKFDEVQRTLREADIVICHAGTGSIITALREHCRVVVMPREHKLGEHYDDHQSEITSAFAARGLVVGARSIDELRIAIRKIRGRPVVGATTDPQALLQWLSTTLDRWQAQLGRQPARITKIGEEEPS